MKILALSGSLRENSSNAALLRAAERLVSATWTRFDLATLPYFDPDLQYSEDIPETARRLRDLGAEANLIFIATPEYAHGVPGLLKNGLEWLFCDRTSRKPVAVVLGSAQGEWARDQLLEILATMDFAVDADSFHLVKGARAKVDPRGTFTDADAEGDFAAYIERLVHRNRSE
ncbi:MAG: NAD(P)H-dependent oxidoreductase [Bdellovibrionales bacterium]|nr:NAD(P)H-dependent oxidoreductase [Bdellovibrionales bacterium]